MIGPFFISLQCLSSLFMMRYAAPIPLAKLQTGKSSKLPPSMAMLPQRYTYPRNMHEHE
ncbi:hypothetical protein BJY01DRAFT_210301 [Aspergillus pseudoustus]|uniref:Uncharacterized protein n=1 Tax=Aspergillus pseudoustus TaxID=1810923 RepID=A0ABR4KC02_9EURO